VFGLRRRNPRTLLPHELTSVHSSSSAASSSAGDLLPELVLMAPTCGAKLLHWLHERRLNGEPMLQACVQRLLWHVNQVVFNQLSMWCVWWWWRLSVG
jgi:hypothetical protein